MDANKPVLPDGTTYHLRVRKGDIAPYCLLVGAPERAELIAETMLSDARLMGNHRGLKTYTGRTKDGVAVSVVTTAMGSASTAIVLPEAAYAGAKRFICVGSCSALRAEVAPGNVVICTGAVRLDGASECWAPLAYPAVADFRVTAALVEAAQGILVSHHVGIGVTTADFVEGQARPDLGGYVPPRLQALHDELVQRNALFYSMEEATIFVWCTTHGTDYWAGAVDAVFGNRMTNAFEILGETEAASVALGAVSILEQRYPIM